MNVFKVLVITSMLLVALLGCNRPDRVITRTRLIEISNIEDDLAYDSAVSGLPKDSKDGRAALLELMSDTDQDVRIVVTMALGQSKQRFQGFDFERHFKDFPLNSSAHSKHLLSIYAKLCSKESRSYLTQQLEVGVSEKSLLEPYVFYDNEHVKNVLANDLLTPKQFDVIERIAHENNIAQFDESIRLARKRNGAITKTQ